MREYVCIHKCEIGQLDGRSRRSGRERNKIKENAVYRMKERKEDRAKGSRVPVGGEALLNEAVMRG